MNPLLRKMAGLAIVAVIGWAGRARAQTSKVGAPSEERPGTAGVGSIKDAVKDAVKDTVKVILPGAKGSTAAAGAAAAGPANDPAARAAALRKKVLREEDFVDNDDSNRDPFKSFIRLFVEKTVQKVRTVPAIFEKFALEELALIGIVSGDAQPRAMFRDPGGLGQTIKRGDYVSKAGARVTKILSDRVILELAEVTSSGESKPFEKAVLLNPEETQK